MLVYGRGGGEKNVSECWQRHVFEDAFIEHSQRLEGHFGWRIFCEANTVIEGTPKLPSLKLTWPLKIGGWKLLSVWDGLFPGPMLVSGNVQLYTERFRTMDWLESQGSGNQLNKKQTELYKPMFRQAGSDWKRANTSKTHKTRVSMIWQFTFEPLSVSFFFPKASWRVFRNFVHSRMLGNYWLVLLVGL